MRKMRERLVYWWIIGMQLNWYANFKVERALLTQAIAVQVAILSNFPTSWDIAGPFNIVLTIPTASREF